ncbi:27513_t:CDS:2 [Dentiscutata erythropus]|uniref:27513_t:CDS:1 n=1 Tax=Dentiscutata erythropus TaxID=1348616 RepID=A0A9N9G3H2_9GLOM|nr:27513_t:CDS:2 [Dentiscutata erythropus]
MSEEKIILNIGDIKYETLRSTLIAQPETLLGTMFQDQNEFIKNSINGNEYFFNRNGEAFYYIMEFYRTGKLLWPTKTKDSRVTYQQLKEEIDYFRINKSKVFFLLASETAISAIDQFTSILEQLIISNYVSFNNEIFLKVSNNNILNSLNQFREFRGCAFDILHTMEKQIEKHLVETFSELELKWKCQRECSYSYNSHECPFFEIKINFSSPVDKLLKSENVKAQIAFTQVPVNTSEEKIVLNVGGKKYLLPQPETLLGAMFQDRNKCMRHPINGNEYFFDRNSEAFYYIMEFYRTGKLTWPTESEKVTCEQLEVELDYFQIPFNKSKVLCSSAFETVRNNYNNLLLSFEELIIRCCNCFRNHIKLEIRRDGIRIVDNNKSSDNKHYYYLQDLQKFCLSKFKNSNAYYPTLDNMEKQIGDYLMEMFSDLELEWEFSRAQDHSKLYISISFSFENIIKILNER